MRRPIRLRRWHQPLLQPGRLGFGALRAKAGLRRGRRQTERRNDNQRESHFERMHELA
jgi:hypothetical protein